MDNSTKTPATRRNKFAGKEDVSRHATDSILTGQIDTLREMSNTTNEATTKLRESVGILYETKVPVNTDKFEHLTRHFIDQMEEKLRKVKHPSKGLQWYIAMWVITLAAAFLAGYYIQEARKWKADSMFWFRQYEAAKDTPKIDRCTGQRLMCRINLLILPYLTTEENVILSVYHEERNSNRGTIY